MRTKIEWQARVTATEKIDSLPDYCDEVLRGLVTSELVPEGSWINEAHFDFNDLAVCTVRWDTINEMDRDAHTSVA